MRTITSLKFRLIAASVVALVAVVIGRTGATAQVTNVGELPHPLGVRYVSADTANAPDTVHWMPDTSCSCHASLPLEIVATSLIAGIPGYWGYRGFFDDTGYFRPELGLVTASFLLFVVSLAPVAELTSGCRTNWWNALWIGAGSSIATSILYYAAYGHNHILNVYRINWPEYAALGVAPTVIASLVYNQFLHPRLNDPYGHNRDQGMYILPSVGWDRSLALNFGMRF